MHHSGRALILVTFLLLIPVAAFGATNIAEYFGQLEKQYQLPAGILGKVAMVESGGNPNARAKGSSALGMFQWLDSSWQQASHALYGYVVDPSRRTDPSISGHVTAFALAQSKARLGSLIAQAKVDMTVGLYMGHFLGQGGASQFFSAYLQNPASLGASLFPKAAGANQGVFYSGGKARSLAEIVNFFANKLGSAGVPNIAGDFSTSAIQSSDFLANATPPKSDAERDFQTNYSTGRPPAAPNPLNSATMPQLPVGQPNKQTANQTPAASSSPTTTAGNAPSALLIIAQSPSISRGGSTLISWVSVGQTSSTCTVTKNDAPFASGPQGSKLLNYTDTQILGAITFAFECKTRAGAVTRSSVDVTVQ